MLRAAREDEVREADILGEFLAASIHGILFANGVYPHSTRLRDLGFAQFFDPSMPMQRLDQAGHG